MQTRLIEAQKNYLKKSPIGPQLIQPRLILFISMGLYTNVKVISLYINKPSYTLECLKLPKIIMYYVLKNAP